MDTSNLITILKREVVEGTMNKLEIMDLAQPIGGVMSSAYVLPNTPGEPKYSTYACELGDLKNFEGYRDRNGGKAMTLSGAGGDITPEIAKFKAYAEGLERYCNSVYNEEQFIWATADELGEDALDLDTVPVCSDNEIAHPFCPLRKPDKFEKIRWVKGMSLTQERPKWIPAMMVYLYIPFKSPAEVFHLPISTGSATHTDINQAVINGINEVIERDAISLTWLHRISWPHLEVNESDLPSWAKPFYEQTYNNEHVKTYYLNATTDIGIPTIYGVQFSPYNKKFSSVVMCTTDLDPLQAFTKITRETASVKYALQHTEPKTKDINHFREVFDGAHYMGDPSKMEEFNFLTKSEEKTNLFEMENLTQSTSEKELKFLLNRLKEKNHEVFIVDMTTDEAVRCGFRTVKVIIPSLQPLSFVHRARYLGHKRLYAAALNLGLGHRTEADINPNPSPFA
jgi:ribosomal protein S12 methylthiotransferase accessory factor